MSCRTVATDCSSRRSFVGGPSLGLAGGKNDGGRGAVPGISAGFGREVRALDGGASGMDGDDGDGDGDGDGEAGVAGAEPTCGRGGVGCDGGRGRRGLVTQSESMPKRFDVFDEEAGLRWIRDFVA
jgi:hypothetical protein